LRRDSNKSENFKKCCIFSVVRLVLHSKVRKRLLFIPFEVLQQPLSLFPGIFLIGK